MKVRVRVEPPKAVTVSVVVLVRHADNVRIGPKTITENGTFYPANESLDGYSPVVVDVSAQPKLQDKTVDPAIVPVKVQADPPNDGLGEVTVNAMPVEEQVTPQITVDEETGVVTARASQPSGYVVGGTKENSKQLETKGAQIYTPGDEENIIPAGVFLTGKQTLAKVPTQETTITENGEHIPPSGKYYSKVVVAVPESGGTDTDDANATPNDMAAGTSGYVKGKKVEGNLPVKAAGSTETVDGEGLAIEGGKLKMTTTAPADSIHRAGAKTEVETNADALGIATPDMVLEDATFTSKDGIGQEGTIPRNGDTSATFDGIEVKSVDIPAGYTTGGKVELDGTIDNAVEAAKTSLANKGVDVPTDTDVRGLAGLIDGISTGTAAPSAENVTFGNVWTTVVTPVEEGKCLYNGVLLPELPADVLTNYPYVWIRNNTTTGYYDLLMATGVWFLSSADTLNHNDSNAVTWYRVDVATAENASAWTYNTDLESSGWGCESGRDIVWSNHDIPNGSASATAIYFKGTEPATESSSTEVGYAKREPEYTVQSEYMNAIAAYAQRFVNRRILYTPEQIVEAFSKVIYIPQGWAESALSLTAEIMEAESSGILPEVIKGKATSVLDVALELETEAVGDFGFEPYWTSACYENTGGTSLTGTIVVTTGDWILATVTTRSDTTYPSGWTVLRESTVLNSDALNQRMAILCKQATADETLAMTIEQTESARIYLTLMAFSGIQGFAYHAGTEVYCDTEKVNRITTQRPSCESVVWACTAPTWSTSVPHGEWTMLGAYNDPVCLNQASTAPRQANFVDDDTSDTERVFIPGTTNTYYIVDCVEILK